MAGISFSIRSTNHFPMVQKLLVASIDDILDDTATLGKKVAKARVPVLTGALQADIHTQKIGKTVKLIADLEYAAIIEFGGVNRPPQPYMRPAALEMQMYLKAQTAKLAGRLTSEYS